MPMFILSFVLPEVLIAGANFAVRFVGDANTISRLVPFVMLLVGFIPASFSLITALETFVGERERNSLEALLSMPISDNQLYLGKLVSSLLPPLLSSYTAMIVFAVSLRFGYPDLFFLGLTFEYLVLGFVLITFKAMVMVASAVIISSHTTSVRAANLLASFVLLPTASVVQLEAILIISRGPNSRTVLWLIALLLCVMAVALIRTGMGAFNREEILSREHEQLNLRHVGRTWRTFFREYRPAGVAPDQYSGASFSFGRFYRRELPALLRDYRLPLLVALIAAGWRAAGRRLCGQQLQGAPARYLPGECRQRAGTGPGAGAIDCGQQHSRRAVLECLLAVRLRRIRVSGAGGRVCPDRLCRQRADRARRQLAGARGRQPAPVPAGLCAAARHHRAAGGDF